MRDDYRCRFAANCSVSRDIRADDANFYGFLIAALRCAPSAADIYFSGAAGPFGFRYYTREILYDKLRIAVYASPICELCAGMIASRAMAGEATFAESTTFS